MEFLQTGPCELLYQDEDGRPYARLALGSRGWNVFTITGEFVAANIERQEDARTRAVEYVTAQLARPPWEEPEESGGGAGAAA